MRVMHCSPTTIPDRRQETAIHLAYFDPVPGPVPNPGMGVTAYVHSDHMHIGFTNEEWNRTQALPPVPLDHRSLERMLALPGIDNLYIRMEWADVQRQAGRLDLPREWEWLLEAVERHGKSWGFRIMPCSPHSMRRDSGIPDFLANRVRMIPYWHRDMVPGPRPKFFSDYSAEHLDRWEELLHLLGARFDNDSRLEYVDVSGYGFWGELHHWASYDGEEGPKMNFEAADPEAVMERLIRNHLAAFPRTPAALGLHAADYGAGRRAFADGSCWPRRDSWMANFGTAEALLAQGAVPGTATLWETIRPGLSGPLPEGTLAPDVVQRYVDLQAHYAAVGFNPWDMIQAHASCLPTLQSLGQHLGYRLRPSVVLRRQLGDHPQELALFLRNDGSSQVPGRLTITAAFPRGRTVSIELDAGAPLPGRMHLVTLPYLVDHDVRAEEELVLTASVRCKAKGGPVRWAVAGAPGGTPELRVRDLGRPGQGF